MILADQHTHAAREIAGAIGQELSGYALYGARLTEWGDSPRAGFGWISRAWAGPLRRHGRVKTTKKMFAGEEYKGPYDSTLYDGPMEAVLAEFGPLSP